MAEQVNPYDIIRAVDWLTYLRHCEPTGRANARPMTGSAKQSSFTKAKLDCFVASAPRKKLALGKAAATIKTVVAPLERAIQ
jgi:hypothetical protein